MTAPTSFDSRHPAPPAVRSRTDLIAVVPVVLGFRPRESLVVMCTADGLLGPVARVDLPPEDGSLRDFAFAVTRPLLRWADTAILLVYADPPDGPGWRRPHHRVVAAVERALNRGGIRVADILVVGPEHWWDHRDPTATRRSLPSPNHPLAVRLGGEVLPDRAALEALATAPDPAVVPARTALLAATAAAGPHGFAQVLTALTMTAAATDADRAAAVVALADRRVRDEAICWALAARPDGLIHRLTDLVRWAPDEWVAETAAVAAVLAYRNGNGALALVLLDRIHAVEPAHTLAGLVHQLLAAGVPPDGLDDMISASAGP